MGVTAENLAKQWNITRKSMDEFALKSQVKACNAIEYELFKDEIFPVKLENQKTKIIVSKDEGPREGIDIGDLSKLKPVFAENGLVTAGNSSGINDGAATVILMSEDKVRELGVKPMAEWVGGCLSGVDPAIMGTGPIKSTNRLLNKLNININDIDLIEVNEAFAVQTLVVANELQIPMEKLNINGGAIALGHPVGASGCRILVTLLHAMRRRNAKLGLATLCIGGGMGCSALVRSCEYN